EVDVLKKLLILSVFLCLVPVAWADQPAPPVITVPSGDEALPPPLDQNQTTPVAIPVLPDSGKTNAETAPTTTQPVLPPPVLMTSTPVPVKVMPTVPVEKKVEAAPTPKTEVHEQAGSNTAVSAGILTDYFPVKEGAMWVYEYLKPAPGETAKKNYPVRCVGTQSMPNGTVRATFETTENGHVTQDHYSLFDNKVEHMAADGKTETGDFVFKVPAKGGAAAWTVTEKDGTIHKSKAAFGQAQVYQKTYPDCIVVTEKVVKGGKAANTVIYYYAKGIGLVAIEVYSPKMKLLQDKSVALMSGPGGGINN
ncbi:MAG TPA: hypothetical protein VJ873_11040, partial [bacterium]|nr:hypothetical protein [bacterium]